MEITEFCRVEGEHVFKLNETFDSYDELMQRLELHTQESLVHYWRRDSRTIEMAFKKTLRPLDRKLKYYSIKFACVFGGQKPRHRGLGIRPARGVSRQTDCPSFISLKVDRCGTKLEVVDVCNDHNHEISHRAAELLPHNRRPSKELLEEIHVLLDYKINKTRIIRYAKQRENKNVTIKDLFNFDSKRKITAKTCKKPDKIVKRILENCDPDVGERVIRMYKHIYNVNDFPEHNSTIPPMLESYTVDSCLLDESSIIEIEDNTTVPNEVFEIMDESNGMDINSMNQPNNDSSRPILLLENFIPPIDPSDECIDYDPEEDVISTCSEPNGVLYQEQDNSNDETTVLFETNVPHTSSIPEEQLLMAEEDSGQRNFKLEIEEQSHEECLKRHRMRRKDFARFCAKKTRRIIVNCRKCGTNAKLVKMQCEYLKTKRAKLRMETKVLELRKQRLIEQVLQLEEFTS